MSENSAMGKDPLDWVGKGPNGVPHNGKGGSGPSDANGKAAPLPEAQAPYAESQVTAALSTPAESSALAQLELGRRGGTPIEREILLMRGLPRERLHLARQSSRSTVWFLVALVAAVLGTGAFFFLDSRKRWSEHVQTLEGQIRATEWSLRQSAERADELVRSKQSIIQGKDDAIRDRERILREKERLIETLQENRRPGLDFAPSLQKIREIGQRMGRAFRLLPEDRIAGEATQDAGEKTEVDPPLPFKPVPAIPGSLKD